MGLPKSCGLSLGIVGSQLACWVGLVGWFADRFPFFPFFPSVSLLFSFGYDQVIVNPFMWGFNPSGFAV